MRTVRGREYWMIGNAHLDPVWLWRWTEGLQEARATLTSAVTLLEEDADYVFTFDQVALLEWIEEADPDLFARVRSAVAAGRLEIAGGWWVEPDCNLSSGEAYVRQGLLGQRYLREKLGMMSTVGCNIDPFGHHGMLPQILRGQGLDFYCFMRPGPHEAEFSETAFRWRSPDGSEVVAYRIPHEYQSSSTDLGYHLEKAVNQIHTDVAQAMVFYGVGNHGGGPTRDNLAAIAELNRRRTFGKLRLATTAAFFDALAADADALPVWESDLQMHAPGCYSAATDVKALYRRAEQELLRAERLSVLAQEVARTAYPADELRRAWKQLLFNAFHDILPGSAIEEALDDARHQLGEVISIAARATNCATQTVARDVNVPFEEDTFPILVFNPHPHRLSAPIEVDIALPFGDPVVVDHQGSALTTQELTPAGAVSELAGKRRHRVHFVADLPPLGYTLYRIRERGRSGPPAETSLRAADLTLSNDLLEVSIDPVTGWIATLRHKPTGVDFFGPGLGAHTVVSDDNSDTWGHRVRSYVADGDSFAPQAVELIEDGPLRATVRVRSRCGESRMVEWFSLSADSDSVHVRVELDWREQRKVFKLRFPTAIAEAEATFEIPFAHQRRIADGTEYPGQSWAHLGGTIAGVRVGMLVLNSSKLAYDATDGNLGITAVRSPIYAWHDPSEVVEGEHYSYQAQGPQRFEYHLVPHGGDLDPTDAARRAASLLMSPVTMFEGSHEGALNARHSIIDADQSQVVVTAIKAAEDDADLTVLRAVNPNPLPTEAHLTVPNGGSIREHFRPYEIRTFLISTDGTATPTNLLEDPIPRPLDDPSRDG